MVGRRIGALAVALVVVASACGGGSRGEDPEGGTSSDATTSGGEPSGPDLGAVSVRLEEVATGLDRPTALAVRPGDDALYVTEQSGRLRLIRDGELLDEPVVDLSDEVSSENEQGLLGVVFSPDGERLYLDFTDTDGDTHVIELAVVDGEIDLDSRREILRVDQPFPNHNAGQLVFGPDGYLYVALGDGGGAGDPEGNAQDLSTLLGSILRIDPTPSGDRPYTVPDDNPFVGEPGARPEIWHYGLRNPWRFTFDRETGDMWIGDVGQSSWEEIDFAPAGEGGINWGWPLREGTHEFSGPRPPDARDPIFEYDRNEGVPVDGGLVFGVAVAGGYVYRGTEIPELVGAYVFADFRRGELVALVQRDGELVDAALLGAEGGAVSSFAEDADGELYVLDLGGRVLRLVPD